MSESTLKMPLADGRSKTSGAGSSGKGSRKKEKSKRKRKNAPASGVGVGVGASFAAVNPADLGPGAALAGATAAAVDGTGGTGGAGKGGKGKHKAFRQFILNKVSSKRAKRGDAGAGAGTPQDAITVRHTSYTKRKQPQAPKRARHMTEGYWDSMAKTYDKEVRHAPPL